VTLPEQEASGQGYPNQHFRNLPLPLYTGHLIEQKWAQISRSFGPTKRKNLQKIGVFPNSNPSCFSGNYLTQELEAAETALQNRYSSTNLGIC